MIASKTLINKIQTQNPGRWLVVDTYPITNFPIIFGAPTINSTNIYPNLKLWRLIDAEGKYEDVYNRYCNISTIMLLRNSTSVFETVLPETIVLYLSFYDLPKLRVNYIFSTIMSGQYAKFPNGVELIPLYNENGNIEIKNNRFWAWHVGLSGNPLPDLHYRVLATYQKGWGTYYSPYIDPRKSFCVLAEASYELPHNWQLKGSLGMDSGEIYGENYGIQLTVTKTGILQWRRR